MDGRPIFIGGLDRTGKTWLRLCLASHPNIAISRRTNLWTRFYGRYGDLSIPDNFERCLAGILAQKSMQTIQPDPARIRLEFRQGEPSYARLFAIIYRQYAESLGKSRWGDQLAFIEVRADRIFGAYPAAKMIHMLRDPRERYLECWHSKARRAGMAGRETARWLYSVRLARRNQRRYPQGYTVIYYESFISRREATLRQLCAFLEEEFFPEMLEMSAAQRFGNDHPGSQEREPAGEDGARDDLSARLSPGLAFIQAFARRELLACGYALRPVRLSRGQRLSSLALDWPANLAGLVYWSALKPGRSD
jgi:hypothetical protein